MEGDGNYEETLQLGSEQEKVNNDQLAKELIQAAKDSDKDKVRQLLSSGVDPNVRDEEGRTALHWAVILPCPCQACGQNAEACLFTIFAASTLVDTNAQDNLGLTPLHIAADNKLEKCCKMLVYHGADVYKPSHSGEVPMTIIAKRAPDVMVFLLDLSISLDGNFPTSERIGLSMDFRTILGDVGGDKVPARHRANGSGRRDRFCSCQGRNELHLLRSLLHSSKLIRTKIFTHPTVAVFLDQKWRRVRKHFWATFICYVIWLILYTGFILLIYLIDCPCKLYMSPVNSKIIGKKMEVEQPMMNQSDQWNFTESPKVDPTDKTCLQGSALNLSFFVGLLILTMIMAAYEISKMCVTPRLYFKSRLNVLHWILLAMTSVTFYPTLAGQSEISPVQYQIAALTIFLAWSLILSQVGKFPSIGIYLEIFGHVLRQFWFFLLTYVSLFIAFALAFSILFPGSQPYTIFPFAFLKIFVMMVGEMEYQDVFYDEATGKASGPIVGHLLYATFVIVVAIVLMNLLIGLTVSDIRGLQKEAEMSRVSRQIVDMFHLESFLFSKKFPQMMQKGFYRMTSVARQIEKRTSDQSVRLTTHSLANGTAHPLLPNKHAFKFLPNDSRDKSVPEKLKVTALELALKLDHERKEKSCIKKKGIFPKLGESAGGGLQFVKHSGFGIAPWNNFTKNH